MGCTVAIIVILLLTYYGDNVGDFTIAIDRDDFAAYGLSLSESETFEQSTSRLVAESYDEADPIGNITNYPNDILPEGVMKLMDEGFTGGSQNGYGFLAYTFYLKNAGTEIVNYKYAINIESVTNNLDAAIRVMVFQQRDVAYNEGDPIQNLYAKKQGINGERPGEAEFGTTPFASTTSVVETLEENLNPGSIDRYTVVMWTEGHDVDCTNEGANSIIKGIIRLTMKFTLVKQD